jgi:excisionase family DNA binding protein
MPLVDLQPGYTIRQVARRYRVGKDTVAGWVARGELKALNIARHRCGKRRFVITPEAMAEFERARQAGPPPKAPRRRKQTSFVDYFPD